jgi:type I restriction enzyme M protein
MVNERITENFVREHFKKDILFKSIKLEEQKTKNKFLKECLKHASKNNTKKQGYPEFIITFNNFLELVIIVECKANIKFHQSKNKSEPKEYAVDGVLHYSNFLKNGFNVIAIAVSGENEKQLKVSNFIFEKKSEKVIELEDKEILNLYEYLNIIEKNNEVEKLKDESLIKYASQLNKDLYNKSIPENERATIVSGILIGLQDKSFRKTYKIYKEPIEIYNDLIVAIERVLKKNEMGEKIVKLLGEYKKIKQSNKLINKIIRNEETKKDEENKNLRDLIFEIDKKVFPYTKNKHLGYDILGQFYSEFISYCYGDKKLGLVLTPQHITGLFVDLAELSVDDIIYDNCTGTGSFLIKGMKKLFELAKNNEKKKREIKKNQLIGVELRPDMFTYACSNMMLRGDGKSNIYDGDSLSENIKNKIKKHKPTVGFLNPPYSTNVSELEFIYENLDCLEKNGKCIAIIPISCLNETSGRDYEWKKKLLKEHTLEGVFSMPDELFYPVGTVTSIVIFKAHCPHRKNYETYFGYWKDDGFIKIKNLGRQDYYHKWEENKNYFLDNYFNRREIKEFSVKKYVTENDEWCAEAYLETNYNKITKELFEETVKNFVIFKMKNEK